MLEYLFVHKNLCHFIIKTYCKSNISHVKHFQMLFMLFKHYIGSHQWTRVCTKHALMSPLLQRITALDNLICAVPWNGLLVQIHPHCTHYSALLANMEKSCLTLKHCEDRFIQNTICGGNYGLLGLRATSRQNREHVSNVTIFLAVSWVS